MQKHHHRSNTRREAGVALCKSDLHRRACLAQMRRDELRHLKHRHFALAAEDGLQLVIREDVALVCWVLKVMLLDIHPKLLDHLGSRHRACADNRLQFRREGKRF